MVNASFIYLSRAWLGLEQTVQHAKMLIQRYVQF